MNDDMIYYGADFKAYIRLEPAGQYNMDDYDFSAEFYTSSKKKVTMRKEDMIRQGENEYHCVLSSKDLGPGMLACTFTRHIPDADYPDGLRTDIQVFQFKKRIIG